MKKTSTRFLTIQIQISIGHLEKTNITGKFSTYNLFLNTTYLSICLYTTLPKCINLNKSYFNNFNLMLLKLIV